VISGSGKASQQSNNVVTICDPVHVREYHLVRYRAERTSLGEAQSIQKTVSETLGISSDLTKPRSDCRSSKGVSVGEEQFAHSVNLFEYGRDSEIRKIVSPGEGQLFNL